MSNFRHVTAHLEIRDTKVSVWFDQSKGNELDVRVTAHGTPKQAAVFAEYLVAGALGAELKEQLSRIENLVTDLCQRTSAQIGKAGSSDN